MPEVAQLVYNRSQDPNSSLLFLLFSVVLVSFIVLGKTEYRNELVLLCSGCSPLLVRWDLGLSGWQPLDSIQGLEWPLTGLWLLEELCRQRWNSAECPRLPYQSCPGSSVAEIACPKHPLFSLTMLYRPLWFCCFLISL